MNKNTIKIVNGKCVNSNWVARFLAKENDEGCQCSFGECKVRVKIGYNGHDPYEYILTEKEIEMAREKIKD